MNYGLGSGENVLGFDRQAYSKDKMLLICEEKIQLHASLRKCFRLRMLKFLFLGSL